MLDPATKGLRDIVVRLLSYSKNPSEPGRNLLVLDLAALDMAGNVKPHATEDVVAVKIGNVPANATPSTATPSAPASYAFSLLPGVTSLERSPSGILSVGLSTLKTFDQVLTANEVVVFGYPTSLGLTQLPQLDNLRPLLRKGIVAGQNPAKRSIVIDCPSYPGNSGGPVLELDPEGLGYRFWVIGVVIQFVPYIENNTTILNSGYSIVAPMDFVLELTK